MANASTPVRIKTVPKPTDKRWNNPEAVARAREFFEEQRFDWVGDVALEPMEDVFASLLVDRDGFAAVVYDHPKVGVWVDVVARYHERGGLTASNASQGGHLESPPFSQKFFVSAGTPEQVWATFQDRVRAVPAEVRQPLTRENIVRSFETAYADEIDWRNAQGGPTEDEVCLELH
jgi:hypothetical protein